MSGRIGKLFLFGALFALVFVIGLRLTFPMGLVTRVVEAQIEKATNFRYDVQIERTRFSGIAGVRLIDVTIQSNAPLEEGEIRLPIRIDSIKARVGLLSAISGSPRVRADIRVDEGRIRVNYGPGDEAATEIRVELFDVQLSKFDPIREIVGMPVVGATSGTLLLAYGDDWRLEGGNLELGIAGLVFGPGSIRSEMFRQFGGAVPLPATDLGNVVIRTPIEGSDITIQQFEASGTDVRLTVGGEVQLRNPRNTTRLGLNIDFQLDGTYVEEAGLGAVLGLPEVQRLQVGDGYALTVSGPLGRPSIAPAARRGR